MTDAGWTSEKPSKEGWYWFRTEVTEEEICRIYQDADDMWWATCTEWDEVYKLDDVLIGAEFLGPITPADREQLAQVTRERDKALASLNEYSGYTVQELAKLIRDQTSLTALQGLVRALIKAKNVTQHDEAFLALRATLDATTEKGGDGE